MSPRGPKARAISTSSAARSAAAKTTTLSAADNVTIAEARDSATVDTAFEDGGHGWFSSNSKHETHTESETARGSSVSGGTGVAINSGGDTLISASKVAAGNDDPNTKADIAINAGGNLVIASGRDTFSEDRHGKSDGFLSSGSSSSHRYDERIVGSQLSASGNVNLNAGGAAVIMGSKVDAGGSIIASADSVSVIGAQEAHQYSSKSQESGLFAGSSDGFFSIWGAEKDKAKGASVNNVGSLLTAGKDVRLTARDTDVTIMGSPVGAGNDIALNAARDVNILPSKESTTSKESHENSGFGIAYGSGNGSLSLGIGYGSTSDKVSQGSRTNAVSTLSAGHNLTINAGRDANLQAADVSAEHDVKILAERNVNLLAANDTSNYKAVHEQLFAGVTATVSSGLISAAQSVGEAAGKVGKTSSGYSATSAAFAGYQSYLAIKNATNPDLKNGLGSVSLSAGFTYSSSQSSTMISTPVVTTIRGGNSVTIDAKTGSITGHGVQIAAGYDMFGNRIASLDPNAGNISLKAQKGGITLTGVQSVTRNSGSGTSAGASIGVAAGLGAGGTGTFGPTASASGGNGQMGETMVRNLNSHVTGTGTVTVKSGGDTKLLGAVVAGNRVKTDIGGNLIIRTDQDTAHYNETSTGGSLSLSAGGLGGGVTQATTTGSYVNTSEQSGIVAGDGGFDVKVKNRIDVIGGLIVSTAAKEKNSIDARSMTVTNLTNSMSANTKSLGLALTPSGLPVPAVGQPGEDEDKGKTLSTISAGTVVLHDQDGDGVDDTANDKAATTALLSTVNTDPAKANAQVGMYDIEALNEKSQVAAMVSQMLNTAIGEMAVKAGFKDGSAEKIALHAAAGAITAMITSGDLGLAALAGGGSEAVNALLVKTLAHNPKLSPQQRNAILQWGAALIGAAIGGTQGAAVALDADLFNRQLHQKEIDLIRSNAARFAAEQGYCPNVNNCSAEAIGKAAAELTAAALYDLDDLAGSALNVDPTVPAFAFLDTLGRGTPIPGTNGQIFFGRRPSNLITNSSIRVLPEKARTYSP